MKIGRGMEFAVVKRFWKMMGAEGEMWVGYAINGPGMLMRRIGA